MTNHTGNTCPVADECVVDVDIGDGQQYTDRADAFNWGEGPGPDGEGRVQRYWVRPALAAAA